jgi:hypothetical protein
LSIENSLYLDWALYDFATIAALCSVYFLIKKTTPSFFYVINGLFINSILSLCMYSDMYLSSNREPWFLWDLYTFGVNTIDLLMVAALIIDRDFLGLHILKSKLVSLLKPKKNYKRL